MGGIVILFFLGLSVIVMVISLIGLLIGKIKSKNDRHHRNGGKKIAAIISGGFSLLFMTILAFMFFTIIDAGEVGVQVLFGEVIEDRILTQGLNSKSPFVKVYKYNIRLREYTMSSTLGEGEVAEADGVQARTSDNSLVTVEATIWWSIDPLRAFDIYRKVAKDDSTLAQIVVRPAARNAIYDESSEVTLSEIMTDRDTLGADIYGSLIENVSGKGVIIDKVLVRRITPPKTVDDAIQAKLKAEQDLEAKEFLLEQAKKDAEIQVAKANGIAESQDIIQKKLTPLYVQYEAIQAYKGLAESNNTTFVIMPTSTEGAGLPLIIGANQ